jgi:GxxExxY protein
MLMEFDPLSKQVIGYAIEVHRVLGPGLMESAYRRCLVHELQSNGSTCVSEQPVPVRYKGLTLDCGYRIDLLVENGLILELKCVEKLQPINEAQLLTYMKLAGIGIGLLINFKVTQLKNGLKRFVL